MDISSSNLNISDNSHVKIQNDPKNLAGIPISRVVNKDYLKSLGEIYKCNICFNIMVNPSDCEKCGHSYCLNCITNFKCPFNCSEYKIRPSSLGIKTLLNLLQFKCENEDCNSQINYNSLYSHDQECDYKPTKCPNPKCNTIIPRKSLESHIKEECNFLMLKCKFCGTDFYRINFKEHQETCESVYHSLNASMNNNEDDTTITMSRSGTGFKTNKYLEALNLNIAKIIRENEQKYKTIEDTNTKMKTEISNNVQTMLEKIVNEKIVPQAQTKMHEDSRVDDKKIRDSIKDDLNEVIQANFKDMLSKNTQIFNENINNLEKNIKDYRTNLEKDGNNNKLLQDKDMYNNLTQVIKTSEDKIINSISELKDISRNNENDIYDKINKLFTTYNNTDTSNNNKDDKYSGLGLEELIKENFDKLYTRIETIQSNTNIEIGKHENSDNMSESDKAPEVNIEKITSNFIKNMIEIFDDKMDALKDEINNDIKSINDNINTHLETLNEEIENLKLDVANTNKNTKELKSIITEEFGEISTIINEKNSTHVNDNTNTNGEEKLLHTIENNIMTKLDEMENNLNDKINNKENIIQTEEKITSNLIKQDNICTCGNILNNNNDLIKGIDDIITYKLDNKLEVLEKKIETNFDKRMKEMYDLKWCNECSKVDYFFGFLKCNICSKENCKQCVLLCKGCKNLYCKKCVVCPNCGDLSCLNCRVECNFCSTRKGEKFCSSCMKSCSYCHKLSCQECTKQCITCKNLTCIECSKFCRICDKCSCRRCDSSKNFKTCHFCQDLSCNECVVLCKSCDLEVCKNCFLNCKQCKKLICKKCGSECSSCKDSFCQSCSKDLHQSKCNLCKKQFCITCVKNLRKCKKCGESACRDCCSNCKKCRNLFCNNCNINCDNCDDYVCISCIYKCVCDQLIFCEKCLFDVNPIGPHDCVLWMNDSPVFTGIKSRSKNALPRNFEAKFYLEKFDYGNLLIGITDNNCFNEDSMSFVDNIWAFKAKTGQKYSSKKSLEPYYDKETRERDFIIVAVKNDNLYFRVNFDDNPPAYVLTPNKEYYLYIENDTPMNSIKIKFVYIRKI